MGFSGYFTIGFVSFLTLAITAFMKKKRALGITILCLLAIALFVLGYMWFTSPM